MRKMYNSLVSMFVKGWGKLFGEDKNILEHTPLLLEYEEDPYTCELKEGDIVELLPHQSIYLDYKEGSRYRVGVSIGYPLLGVVDDDGTVVSKTCIDNRGWTQFNNGFIRGHWKKVG